MAKAATKIVEDAITEQVCAIEAPDMRVIEIPIEGTAALMMNRFSSKMKDKLLAEHVAGSAAKQKGKAKPAKDVMALFQNARYTCTPPGSRPWDGIPCSSIRNALVRCCSIVGFHMTAAKQSIFILAEGADDLEKLPLVKIISDPPEVDERIVRNANKQPDVRIRPRYNEWRMNIRVRYDASIFTAKDIVNLMMRAGIQNGLGEGRPFSKLSTGIDLGTFRVLEEGDKVVAIRQ